MWYQSCYRRHLCDMHIDDWNDSFLSQFSPQEYLENLRRAHINNAMLYYQSHAGLCYYPTSTGVMHRAFEGREHLLRDLVELCHADGIRVTGYYSLNYNSVEHDRHPAWRMLDEHGLSRRANAQKDAQSLAFASPRQRRYGFCCPNNLEYRAFVFAQIDEMLDYFNSDALFFDMPFWPHTCYCPACRARWQREVGGEMPVNPAPGSADYNRLTERKYAWMGEWTQAVTDYVKARCPDMPVEHNYASGIAGDSGNGCGEEVCRACDYAGGDLYGGLLEHSFTCKFYRNVTRNQPFEYMFSRCKPALRVHTLTKTLDEMKTAVAITAAHHGATLVIDAIDPVGTMDSRVYDRIGQMFDFQAPYEPYFRGELVEDVGVYYGIRSKTSLFGDEYNSKTCCVAAANTLTRRHIPFGVTGRDHSIEQYSLLIAPTLSSLEEADNQRLIAYVENGGTLYLSGGGNRALVERLTGGRLTGFTQADTIYLAPCGQAQPLFGWFNARYPLPFEGAAPILEGVSPEDTLATLTLPYAAPDETRFASIHSDPPGVPTDAPMIVLKRVGRGTVLWSAVPLEGVAYDEYREILLSLLTLARGDASFSLHSDAPDGVELTHFRGENELLVHAVALCEDSVSPTLPGFRISVRTEARPSAVTLLPGGEALPFTFEKGYVSFSARPLHIFDTYRIQM